MRCGRADAGREVSAQTRPSCVCPTASAERSQVKSVNTRRRLTAQRRYGLAESWSPERKPPRLNLKGAVKVQQLTLNYQRADWRPADVVHPDVIDYSKSILSTDQTVYVKCGLMRAQKMLSSSRPKIEEKASNTKKNKHITITLEP